MTRYVDARYPGQSHELTIEEGADFHAAHERRYGFRLDGEPEIVTRRIVAAVSRPRPELPAGGGERVEGPAVVELPGATCLVPAGWAGEPDAHGTLVLERDVNPIELSVASAALTGIAEEMGTVLVRSSLSANIKERRDCSAALFDARGRMVAQAEHIPVHLGAMPESVAAVIARGPQPGETWILNDPFAGGSHLPDITMVTPLALEGRIAAFACTRAHHSDVGGTAPGSMPATSTSIWQEGVIVPPVRLTDEVLAVLLANVRTPELRRGDLAAQSAANRLAAGAPCRAALPARGGVRGGDRLRGAPGTRGDRPAAGRPLRGRGRGRDGRRPADPRCRDRREATGSRSTSTAPRRPRPET